MKKIIMLLILLFLVFISPVSNAEDKSLLDIVKERGTVRVGTGNKTPPMNYINEKGEWTGFDLDLGKEIAKRLGVKIEWVLVDNKTRIAFLANMSIDMAISNVSQTRSREEQIDYVTPPYLWTGKIFYAKKGRFRSIKELGGKVIGVDQGSNAYIAAPQEIAKYSKKPVKVVTFQSNSECFLALKQGKIDAFSQDAPIVAAVAGDAGVDFEAIGNIYSPAFYAIGVQPNDSKWRDNISFILQDMFKDGVYEEIYQKWFGSKGQFPLSLNGRPRLPKDIYGEMLYIWPD